MIKECQLEPEKGACNSNLSRWYYSDDKNECLRFFYGGCEGNDNRFMTKTECETICKDSGKY